MSFLYAFVKALKLSCSVFGSSFPCLEVLFELLEQAFDLTKEEQWAVLRQKIVFWINALAEDICWETATPEDVLPNMMDGMMINATSSTIIGLVMRDSGRMINCQSSTRNLICLQLTRT